jgi:hypothetical protein
MKRFFPCIWYGAFILCVIIAFIKETYPVLDLIQVMFLAAILFEIQMARSTKK